MIDCKCKICGRTEYIDEREWINKSRCYNCRKINVYEFATELAYEKWGQVCELHVSGQSDYQIARKFKVKVSVITEIVHKYKGLPNQRVLVTFKPEIEEVSTLFNIGERVRIKGLQNNDIVADKRQSSNGFKYKLVGSPNWYYPKTLVKLNKEV